MGNDFAVMSLGVCAGGAMAGAAIGWLGGHLVSVIVPSVSPVSWGITCGLIPLIGGIAIGAGIVNKNVGLVALGAFGAWPISVVVVNSTGFNVSFFTPIVGYFAGGIAWAVIGSVTAAALTVFGLSIPVIALRT